MGMFDHVRCRYPLPDAEAQDLEYQSKSTPALSVDSYVITSKGSLLHEDYETRMEKNADSMLGFVLHRENSRWVPVDFRGELEIHASVGQADGTRKWYSYLLWFKDNRVADLQRGNSWGEIITPGTRKEPA
ncbi:MAG: hypothetical protein HYS12_17390 [Planctomycetes bacterium]|nr:hypothetical protein [Planctomycetota bacterium]